MRRNLVSEGIVSSSTVGIGATHLMAQVQRVIEGECPYCPGIRLRVVPSKYNPNDLWAACSCCGYQFQGSIPGIGDSECGLSLTGWPDGMGGPQNVGRCGHPPELT